MGQKNISVSFLKFFKTPFQIVPSTTVWNATDKLVFRQIVFGSGILN